jgi:hypothetical protein
MDVSDASLAIITYTLIRKRIKVAKWGIQIFFIVSSHFIIQVKLNCLFVPNRLNKVWETFRKIFQLTWAKWKVRFEYLHYLQFNLKSLAKTKARWNNYRKIGFSSINLFWSFVMFHSWSYKHLKPKSFNL